MTSMETQVSSFDQLDSMSQFPMQAMLPHDMPTTPFPPVEANSEGFSHHHLLLQNMETKNTVRPITTTSVVEGEVSQPTSQDKSISPKMSPSVPLVIRKGDIIKVDIGNSRYAVVNMFRGETKVHIRQYSDTGHPTPKGICLSPMKWAALRRAETTLDNTEMSQQLLLEDEITYHLGGMIYAKSHVVFGTVDIRQYFVPRGETKVIPTKKGITLRRFEWTKLKAAFDEITQSSQDLIDVKKSPLAYH